MKCRRLATWKDEQGVEHKDIVWFGSMGIKRDIPKDLTFENATWEQIKLVVDKGLYKIYFHVGDTKTFDYNGEQKTCRIIGFDHQDGKVKSAITCEIVESFGEHKMILYQKTVAAMYAITQTNIYSTVIPDILSKFPQEIVSIMNNTDKTSMNARAGVNDLSVVYTSNLSKLFLFSLAEVNKDTSQDLFFKEGTLYEYYENHAYPSKAWTRSGLVSTRIAASWYDMSSDYVDGTSLYNVHLGFTIGQASEKREEYPARFFNPDDKHDNYSDKQQGVVDSLTQRLSVIRRELWYDVNYGLPLLDKQKSKVAIDAFIGKTVLAHPDVDSIKDFKSEIVNKMYTCSMKIITKYGEIVLNV